MHLKPVPGFRFLSGYDFVKYKKQRMPVFCRFGIYSYYYELSLIIIRYFQLDISGQSNTGRRPGRRDVSEDCFGVQELLSSA